MQQSRVPSRLRAFQVERCGRVLEELQWRQNRAPARCFDQSCVWRQSVQHQEARNHLQHTAMPAGLRGLHVALVVSVLGRLRPWGYEQEASYCRARGFRWPEMPCPCQVQAVQTVSVPDSLQAHLEQLEQLEQVH